MCFRIHEFLWTRRMPAVREFPPIFYSCGHGRQQQALSSHRFLWGRGLSAPAQEVPEGTGGCVCFPFLGHPLEALDLRPEHLNPFFGAEPASLPPHRRQILQRGQCAGALGDILTWFRHATTWVLSPLSLCLVIRSRTAEWPGHLTSNDLMPFPSSLLAAPCLQNLPLGF